MIVMYLLYSSGLCHKTITIITLTIVRDATIWSVSLGSYLMTLAKAKIVNYDCNCSFIVQATVITIIN
jgi:hypothetical protein